MTVRSRRSLILPNAIRRAMAYPRDGGVQVIPGYSIGSGPLPLRAIIGWTGEVNCPTASDILNTVKFNNVLAFTTQDGITITNTTTGDNFTITGVQGTGSHQLEYDGTWDVAAPVYGDVIVWAYDGTGDYLDQELEPMQAHQLTLNNCVTKVPEYVSGRVYEIGGVPHVEVTFDRKMVYVNYNGVTVRADGGARAITAISGAGTFVLLYRVASLNHLNVVTWEYSEAAGNLESVAGDPLEDVAAQPITNEIPSETFWDATGNEPGTFWDGNPPDETEWDKQ